MQNYSTLVMIALMVFAFYFLILRPQKKRQQAIQATLSSLTPGSRVLLGSGIFGTIVSLGDRQAVLELSPGVEMTVLKQAIVRTVTDADEDSAVEEYDELDDETAVTEPEIGTQRAAGGSPLNTDSDAANGADRSIPSAGADPKRLS